MQADHPHLPASGAHAAGKPSHAFPQSSPLNTGEEVRDLRVSNTPADLVPQQPAPFAITLPEPLQPAIDLVARAHQPLHFLLQTALVAISPFAEMLGMPAAIARAAQWSKK